MKAGEVRRAYQSLETDSKRLMDLTGNLERISVRISVWVKGEREGESEEAMEMGSSADRLLLFIEIFFLRAFSPISSLVFYRHIKIQFVFSFVF